MLMITLIFVLEKTITENGEDYYIGLDDDNEYDLVVAYFAKNLLKEIDG